MEGLLQPDPSCLSGFTPPTSTSYQSQRRSWEDGDLSVVAKPPMVPERNLQQESICLQREQHRPRRTELDAPRLASELKTQTFP